MNYYEKLNELTTKEEKLNFLNLIQFPIRMKKKGNTFFIIIPLLGLVASDDDANKAFQKAEELKEKYFSEMIDVEVENEIQFPEDEEDKPFLSKSFILKYLFIFFFCLITAFGTGKIISNAISNAISSTADKIEDALYPPERRRLTRIEKFKGALKNLEPYINEVKKAIE